jgi:MSHA biogenesis protein MshN
MSLINKMLQELDARRSEMNGTGVYGSQVRAVPQRRRSRAPWWIAVALGAILVAVIAWQVARPVASTVTAHAGTPPMLPLKPDTKLKLDEPALVVPGDPPPAQPVAMLPADPALDGRPREIPVVVKQPSQPISKPLPAVETPVPPTPSPSIAGTSEIAPAATARAVPNITKAATLVKPEPAAPATIDKKVNELTPAQRAENEFRRATLLVQQGKTAEAIGGLEQALKTDSRHAAARQALVGMLLDNNRLEDAMQRAKEGLEADVAQPGLAMILARLQVEKGELQPAIDTLQRTGPYSADRADYAAFHAALLQRNGRHKEAADQYLLALQRAPQNGVWWMGLGISMQADGRPAHALEAFSRARASDTLSPDLLAFVEGQLRQLQR